MNYLIKMALSTLLILCAIIVWTVSAAYGFIALFTPYFFISYLTPIVAVASVACIIQIIFLVCGYDFVGAISGKKKV